MSIVSTFTRQELEAKLLHMTELIVNWLGEEWISRIDPVAKVIRTEEAELENELRIKQFIISIFPLWDMIKITKPAFYDAMDGWIRLNHKLIVETPCACEGCKTLEVT